MNIVLLSKIDGKLIIIQAVDREFIERNPTREAEYEFLDEAGREVHGVLFAQEDSNFVIVKESRVLGKRKGLGARMYELAARLACEHFGKPLASDETRSADSEGFWIKQVKEGRAICVETTGKPEFQLDPGDRVKGRGGCVRYSFACPPKSPALLEREIAEVLAKRPRSRGR